MPPLIPLVLAASQLGLSAWAATFSHAAIARLLQYEDTSEKAAKISGTAEHELHKTRATQTSGVVVVTATFIWSCVVLLKGFGPSSPVALLVSSTITVGLVAARTHFSNFWTPKTGVPLVQTYNEGIQNSKQLTRVLSYLTVTSGLQALYFAYGWISGML